jgi:molybdenum cofactor cytidylyltransferase
MPSAPEPAPGLHALVLAAGPSRRLGRPKQLLVHEGRTLVERAVDTAEASGAEGVTVVVGAAAGAVAAPLAGRAVQLVASPRWADGMGASLAAGVAGLPADCEGALVLLCDQPRVAPEAIARMAAAWRREPDRVVAAAYGGTAGAPAIFPRRLFPALRALAGDGGARARAAAAGAAALLVPLPEAAFDVDDEAAAAALAAGEHRP